MSGHLDARSRQFPVNERVSAAAIKHFLCFYCGDMFTVSLDYQKHLTYDHQNESIIYQLYCMEKKGAAHESRADSVLSNMATPTPPLPPPAPAPAVAAAVESSAAAVPTTSHAAPARRHTVTSSASPAPVSDKRKYASEDVAPAPLVPQRAQTLVREKIAKELEERRKIENEKIERPRSITRGPSTNERIEKPATLRRTMLVEAQPIVKKRALPPPPKLDTPSPNPQPPPKRQKLVTTPKPGEFRFDPPNEICPFCESEKKNKFVLPNSSAAFQHVFDKHGASITKCVAKVYENDHCMTLKVLPPGTECAACEIQFDYPTLYYLHLASEHVVDLLQSYKSKYPTMNNLEIEGTFDCRTVQAVRKFRIYV